MKTPLGDIGGPDLPVTVAGESDPSDGVSGADLNRGFSKLELETEELPRAESIGGVAGRPRGWVR